LFVDLLISEAWSKLHCCFHAKVPAPQLAEQVTYDVFNFIAGFLDVGIDNPYRESNFG